jgi:hypothetical protein
VLAGAAILYFAVTGQDPRTLIGPPGARRRAGTTIGGSTSPTSGGASGGTPGVLAGIAAVRLLVATRFPDAQVVIVSICRPGAIVAGTSSPSEHGRCNAVDLRILRNGALYREAMDAAFRLLTAIPHCELCWAGQGGCTTDHNDHIHFAPVPCLAS